jgi:hypothetical protein
VTCCCSGHTCSVCAHTEGANFLTSKPSDSLTRHQRQNPLLLMAGAINVAGGERLEGVRDWMGFLTHTPRAHVHRCAIGSTRKRVCSRHSCAQTLTEEEDGRHNAFRVQCTEVSVWCGLDSVWIESGNPSWMCRDCCANAPSKQARHTHPQTKDTTAPSECQLRPVNVNTVDIQCSRTAPLVVRGFLHCRMTAVSIHWQ